MCCSTIFNAFLGQRTKRKWSLTLMVYSTMIKFNLKFFIYDQRSPIRYNHIKLILLASITLFFLCSAKSSKLKFLQKREREKNLQPHLFDMLSLVYRKLRTTYFNGPLWKHILNNWNISTSFEGLTKTLPKRMIFKNRLSFILSNLQCAQNILLVMVQVLAEFSFSIHQRNWSRKYISSK